MTALATALQRVWSAKNRLPRLTGRGTPISAREAPHPNLSERCWTGRFSDLGALAKRAAPTIVLIALRIFR